MAHEITIRSITLLTVLALAVPPALAQGGGGRGIGMGMGGMGGMGMGNPDAPWRQRFASIDANSDGVLTRDEMRSNAEAVFAAMDADDDGKLTHDEYMSVRMGPRLGGNPARMEARQKEKAARFWKMDTNGDGKVDRAEFLKGAEARFASTDRNGDGRVTPQEFRARGW